MELINGDCIEEMKKLPENSVDAIVTDPPYGLEFMGKEWDKLWSKRDAKKDSSMNRNNDPYLGARVDKYVAGYEAQQFHNAWAKECLRVLKPGGFLLSFGGTRTYHRMACGIEDAGFEIRDCIQWLYGSGFPKSLNIGKQIDKMNFRFYDKGFQDYCNECRNKKGYSHNRINELMNTATTGGGFSSSVMGNKQFNELPTLEMYSKLKQILQMDNRYDKLIKKTEAEREVIGKGKAKFLEQNKVFELNKEGYGDYDLTAPATPEAKQWEGYGTALKPANEPIVVARKPLSEKNVALNVLKWRTGGINIDGCRIGHNEPIKLANRKQRKAGWNIQNCGFDSTKNTTASANFQGRFPANILFDEEAARLLDLQSGKLSKGGFQKGSIMKTNGTGGEATGNIYGVYGGQINNPNINMFNGNYGASRFFYCAKASRSERNAGCDNLPKGEAPGSKRSKPAEGRSSALGEPRSNFHPTVKPVKLMQYLIRLVAPKGATVLDPFMGSGTTGIAHKEGVEFIGIEKDAEYIKIARARINHYSAQRKL